MYCVATLLLPGMPKRHIVQRAIPMKGRTSLSRKERMDDLNAFVTNVEKPGAQSGTTAIESKRWGSEQPHKSPERKDTMTSLRPSLPIIILVDERDDILHTAE